MAEHLCLPEADPLASISCASSSSKRGLFRSDMEREIDNRMPCKNQLKVTVFSPMTWPILSHTFE